MAESPAGKEVRVRHHTVILLGDDPHGVMVAERLVAWSAQGALHPMGLAGPPDVEADGGPRQRYVERGAVGAPVSFHEWAARHHLDLLRILVVFTDPDPVRSTALARVAAAFRREVEEWSGPACRVLPVTCHLAAPGDPTYPTAAAPDWPVRLVIDPTDRARPDSAGTPLHRWGRDGQPDGRLSSVAAATVAAVGGLWSHQASGPCDDPDAAVSGVRVVRTFHRLVDLPDPTAAVARLALVPTVDGDEARWPAPTAGLATVRRSDDVVAPVAEALLAQHDAALRLDPPSPFEESEMGSVPPGRALRWFLGYLATGVDAGPSALFGSGPTDPGEPVTELEGIIGAEGDRGVATPAHPDLWRDYVRTGLALVDGSPAPEGISAPTAAGRRAVVTSPSAIVAPSDTPGHAVPPSMVDEIAGIPPVIGPLDPQEALRYDAALRAARGAGAEAAVARFEAWLAERRTDYAWTVGERLAASVLEAEERFHSARQVVDGGPPPRPTSVFAPPQRVVGYLITAFLVAASVLVLWAAVPLGTTMTLWTVAAVITTALLASFLEYRLELEVKARRIHAYRLDAARLAHATAASVRHGRELAHMGSLYWQWRRWTKVLRGALHEPFGPPAAPESVGPPTLLAPRPLGVRAAIATGPGNLEALAGRVHAEMFTTGWATRAWEAVLEDVATQVRERQVLPSLSPAADPFTDTPTCNSGALVQLAETYNVGGQAGRVRPAALESIRRLLAARPLGELVAGLTVDGTRYPDAVAPEGAAPVDGFTGEVVRPRSGDFHSGLWRRPGPEVGEVAASVLESVPRPGAEPSVRHGRLSVAVARVEFSHPCAPGELVMFEASERPSPPGVSGRLLHIR